MKKLFTSLCLVFLIFWLPFYQPVKSENIHPTELYVSCDYLDFYRWSKDSTPNMSFIIYNWGDGILKGDIKPSTNWIKISDPTFESNLKEIVVKLDLTNLSPGLYKEKIEIKSNGGDYTLPIRLDLVEKKVILLITYDNRIVIVDSKEVLLNAAPFVMNGLSYFPIRFICESFGATISFERVNDPEAFYQFNIHYQDKQVQLLYNRNYMMMNGTKLNIPGPIAIRNDTAFIPLRAFEDIFVHIIIQANSDSRTITLVY